MHVENLTHSLTGAVIARTGLGDKVPFGTAALVVAANLPDLDSVATFWGILVYLDYHRGVTHSVLGIVGLSCLFTGLLWLLNQKRGNPINTTFRAILGPVTLVVATHSLMDFTNSYGWRPFLPFLEQWYYGDLVFIVDPYLWLLFGGAVFLTGRQSAVTLFFWIAGAAFLLYLVGVQRIIGPGHEGGVNCLDRFNRIHPGLEMEATCLDSFGRVVCTGRSTPVPDAVVLGSAVWPEFSLSRNSGATPENSPGEAFRLASVRRSFQLGSFC